MNLMTFSYHGGKGRIASLYPEPVYDTIIEPFAGSARYSLLYHDRNVVLWDTNQKTVAVLEYLIGASKRDILNLPDVEAGDDIRDFCLSEEQRFLIGFQAARGDARPRNIISPRSTWNRDKIRIADTVGKIKHWKVEHRDAMATRWKSGKITYFIDPPYQVSSHGYKCRQIDYVLLKKKIETVNAHTITCGNEGDTWGPFTLLCSMHGTNKIHTERVWERW